MSAKKDDCSTGSCPVVGSDNKPKLVKSSDLPLHGNPYPPKDVIQNDAPGSLELAVKSVRTTVQPYLTPVCAAYQKTSDILSIGVAHTQSTIANLRENRSRLTNILIISGSGLFGLVVARRRGIFKKLLYTSAFVGGATLACYPREARDKTELAYFIARNRLPALVKEQYQNLTGSKSAPPTSGQTDKLDAETNQTKVSKS